MGCKSNTEDSNEGQQMTGKKRQERRVMRRPDGPGHLAEAVTQKKRIIIITTQSMRALCKVWISPRMVYNWRALNGRVTGCLWVGQVETILSQEPCRHSARNQYGLFISRQSSCSRLSIICKPIFWGPYRGSNFAHSVIF